MKVYEYNIKLADQYNLLEYKNPTAFLKTLLALWRRMQSPQEKESAEALYAKTIEKVEKEFGKQTADLMNEYVSSGKADEDDSKLKPAKRDVQGNIIRPAEVLTWPPSIKKPKSTFTGGGYAKKADSEPKTNIKFPYKEWPYKNIVDFLNSKDNKISHYFDKESNWNFWTWKAAGPSMVSPEYWRNLVSPVIGFALYKNPKTNKYQPRGYFFIDTYSIKETYVADLMHEVEKAVNKSFFGVVPANPADYPKVLKAVLLKEQKPTEEKTKEEKPTNTPSNKGWVSLALFVKEDKIIGVAKKVTVFGTSYRLFWGDFSKITYKEENDIKKIKNIFIDYQSKGYRKEDINRAIFTKIREIISKW